MGCQAAKINVPVADPNIKKKLYKKVNDFLCLNKSILIIITSHGRD
jgi:predicted phosphoribosyltransferase